MDTSSINAQSIFDDNAATTLKFMFMPERP